SRAARSKEAMASRSAPERVRDDASSTILAGRRTSSGVASRGMSGSDLLARREIGAALRAGEELVGIAAGMRIKYSAQLTHGLEGVARELFFHEIDLLDADTVFTGDAATQFDAFFEDFVSGSDGLADLLRMSFIVENQRMNIAVACVKYIRNTEPVFGADA